MWLSDLLGLSVDTLWLFAGIFVVAVGARCLPVDLRRPWGGGITGVPVDAALIIFGALMIMEAVGG